MPLFSSQPTPTDITQNAALAEIQSRLLTLEGDRDALKTKVAQLESDYPVSHSHFWGMGNAYNSTSQKSWNKTVSSANDFCRFASLSSAALGDTVESKFPLKAGNYNLELVYLKRTDSGIVSLYLDSAQVGTIDSYNSSTTNINRFTATVSIATTGIHTFKAVITGKNSSSTGYLFAASAVLISPVTVVSSQLISSVRINCGDQSPYTAADGNIWAADNYYTGGVRTDLEAALGAFTVSGTQNQRIYKFERAQDNGSFSYAIPIGGAGIFTLKLLFAENYFNNVGDRIGSVSLNGSPLLSNFDILTKTAKRSAWVEVWTGLNMPTNTVNLVFTNLLINGIELIRTA